MNTPLRVSQYFSELFAVAEVLTALLYNATVKPKIAPTKAPDAIYTQLISSRPASVSFGAPFPSDSPCCSDTRAIHSCSAHALRAWGETRISHKSVQGQLGVVLKEVASFGRSEPKIHAAAQLAKAWTPCGPKSAPSESPSPLRTHL